MRTRFFYPAKLLKIRQDSNTDQTSEDMDELRKASKFAALAEAADEVVSILTQSRCWKIELGLEHLKLVVHDKEPQGGSWWATQPQWN